jgi:nucleoside 2-deoxyribosyltransferase
MWKEKPSCVVAIPASHEFATIRQAVTEQLQEHDVEPLDYASDAIVEKSTSSSLEAVERSDMLIADVTDKNPNILYGLGLADAMRKPVLLLAQKSPSVPSQLAGHQVVVYEPNETEQLSYYLNSWLKAHPLEKYK